jgi:hypothetical protein
MGGTVVDTQGKLLYNKTFNAFIDFGRAPSDSADQAFSVIVAMRDASKDMAANPKKQVELGYIEDPSKPLTADALYPKMIVKYNADMDKAIASHKAKPDSEKGSDSAAVSDAGKSPVKDSPAATPSPKPDKPKLVWTDESGNEAKAPEKFNNGVELGTGLINAHKAAVEKLSGAISDVAESNNNNNAKVAIANLYAYKNSKPPDNLIEKVMGLNQNIKGVKEAQEFIKSRLKPQ